jgi:hypothetical protein
VCFQGAELLQAVQDMSGDEEEGGKEEARTSNRRQPSSSYPEPSNEEASTSSAQYTQVRWGTYVINNLFREEHGIFREDQELLFVSFTIVGTGTYFRLLTKEYVIYHLVLTLFYI